MPPRKRRRSTIWPSSTAVAALPASGICRHPPGDHLQYVLASFDCFTGWPSSVVRQSLQGMFDQSASLPLRANDGPRASKLVDPHLGLLCYGRGLVGRVCCRSPLSCAARNLRLPKVPACPHCRAAADLPSDCCDGECSSRGDCECPCCDRTPADQPLMLVENSSASGIQLDDLLLAAPAWNSITPPNASPATGGWRVRRYSGTYKRSLGETLSLDCLIRSRRVFLRKMLRTHG